MTDKGNPRFFYGYFIVIASFFIIFIMHGLYSTYGVFFNPLQTEFGWNRTVISGAGALAFFFDGLFAVVAGRLTDKFGPRILLISCGFALGIGYSFLSQISTAWQLYFLYGVVVGMCSGSANVSLLSTTTRWFTKRRGLMSGIVKVGTGAGMLVMPLLASWLIASFGWRQSYMIFGVVSAVSIVSVAQFLRRDPSQKGLQPYGSLEEGANGLDLSDGGLSLQMAIGTRQFWMVCAMYFISWYCSRNVMVHIVPHALDLGISPVHAASIISIIGGASILGRMAVGVAGDRYSNRRALVMCFAVLVIALSWLQQARELWALYLFAAIYGISHGGFFTLVYPLLAELMGTRSHGVITGLVLFISQSGGAIGAVLPGRIFDLTGSYQLAFIILIAMSIIGLVLSLLLKPITRQTQSDL